MANNTQNTAAAVSGSGDKSSQLRFELLVLPMVLQREGLSRRDDLDFKTWFGDIDIAMIGIASENDPRMFTNDGIFNQANKPGAVLFVSAEALDSLPVQAREYLGTVMNSKRMPIPGEFWDHSKWVPFLGTIEFDERLSWLLRHDGSVQMDLLLMYSGR